jgi:hypothetical protein
MKKLGCIPSSMMLGIFLFLTAGISSTQYNAIKVKIPFNFNIGSQRFSAGEYNLKPSLQHTTLLQNHTGRALINMTSISVESMVVPRSTLLVFNRYDEYYFLSQIWVAGNTIGRQLAKSSAELERSYAIGLPARKVAIGGGPYH